MAEVLADCGARVTLADIDVDLLEEVTGSLAERGAQARSAAVDVSDADAGAGADRRRRGRRGRRRRRVCERRHRVDPGFAVDGGQQIDTIEGSDWDKVLGVNLNGVLFTMRSAAAAMRKQGSGRIVVISSIAGLRPEPVVCYGYIASKAAIINVVRQAALELAPHGVLVNAVCPGPFKGRGSAAAPHRSGPRDRADVVDA